MALMHEGNGCIGRSVLLALWYGAFALGNIIDILPSASISDLFL